jgi:hypothetical protein
MKQFCQASVRMFFVFVKLANLPDFVIRKFAGGSSSPVFCNRVPAIVKFGAEKQMIRTDARRIIAAMENLHSIRDFAVVEQPRDAMRSHHSARIAHPEMSITIGDFGSGPKPTRFGFLDLCPKANFESFSHARKLIASAAVRVCGNFQIAYGGSHRNRTHI